MIHNLISNQDIVDKASHLREGNILNHEDLCIDKIKLILLLVVFLSDNIRS